MHKITAAYCLFLFVLTINKGYAQSSKIKQGVATYLFKTELGFINSELDFDDSTSLFIFGKKGMDTGAFTHSEMSVRTESDDSGISIFSSSYGAAGYLYYRNFKTKDIIIRATRIPSMSAYTIQDLWLPINWKIETVFNNVSGFKCQKATGYFRGRTYAKLTFIRHSSRKGAMFSQRRKAKHS